MAARTTNFDAIAAAVPLDKTAAVVTGKSGEHYDPSIKMMCAHYEFAPPPTIRPPKGTQDLEGTRFGRFRVIGFLGRRNTKKKGLWIVRCACGRFEERTGKAILNPNNGQDCCVYCRHMENLKKPNAHLRPGHGGWRDRMAPDEPA